MRAQIYVLVLLMVSVALAFQPSGRVNTRWSTLIMKLDKDEQFRIQQQMLRLRRDPKAKKEYIEKTEKRREDVAKKVSTSFWAKKTKMDDDPLDAWKAARDRGEVKDLGYEPAPPKETSVFGFSIPLIASPIDVPQYDNGERFDLRLPYAERGYEDEDADVMGKLGQAFSSLFGKKKKKEEE